MRTKPLFLSLIGITAASAFTGLAATTAFADTIAPGFNTTLLTTCDDCYTPTAQSLGFSANFFGTTYTGAYVSNNGYITFNSGQGTYTPSGLGAGYSGQPIIAPFFADVDTRGIGTTTYGTGTYDGLAAFGVTWTSVGYYAEETDKTNTFQVILVDQASIGAGDFDIYFNYSQIQWETGAASGGTDGLGGVSAAAGYNAGTGAPDTYFQLDGSLVNGALLDGGPDSLVAGTNDGTPGQFLFEVRDGEVITPPPPPPPTMGVPEPLTLSLFGIGIVGAGALRRRKMSKAAKI